MTDKTVYFLRPIGALGPVKIGCSQDSAKRLRTVEIWSPLKLEIAASAPGTFRHENALHHRFAEQRLHGEWFAYSPELGALIEAVASTGGLPPMAMPTTAEEWDELREKRKGKLPRRDNASRLNKYKITKRVQDAERRVYGFRGYEYARPDDIDAIIRGYQGFGSTLATKRDLALIDKYIDRLKELPSVDRSFKAWLDWHATARSAAA